METGSTEIFRLDLDIPPLTPGFLVIEDDETIRQLLVKIVRQRHSDCEAVADLAAARSLLTRKHYDILLLELSLAGSGGSALIGDRVLLAPESVVLVISEKMELETALQAMRRGAFDCITRPFASEALQERLDRAVEEWRARVRCRYYQLYLEKLVNAMTDKVLSAREQIEKAYDMAVAALGAALDLRNPETEEHCRRVAENSHRLGAGMGLQPVPLRNLRWSAYLHDIGKIGIPEHILDKPSSLTPDERNQVKEHPMLGFRMIRNIEFLKDATEVVLYHHEKYDGSGYPFGLKGEDIPVAARIFAVIDTMDAMLYERPYRKPQSFSELAVELRRQAGRHFDPQVVAVFLSFPESAWRLVEKDRKTDSGQGFAHTGEEITEARR